MKTTIAVVIPTYNSAWVIRETLASVFSQTRLPAEVIIVDDASKDDTCAIVEKIVLTAPCPMRLIRMQKNSGGPVRGMNVGVEASTSDTFTILDHDDLLALSAVEQYTDAWGRVDRSLVGIVSSDFTTFNNDGAICTSHFAKQGVLLDLLARSGKDAPLIVPPAQARQLLCHKFCLPMKAAIARHAWQACGGFDESYRSAWDADFTWRVSERFAFAVVNNPLVHIRIHDNNLSHRDEVSAPEILHVYRQMHRDVRDRDLRRVLAAKINNELFDLAYIFRSRSEYLSATWYFAQLFVNRLLAGKWWRISSEAP